MEGMKPLKIVMVASECVPFAKTGGLADVVGALPVALQALGHEVIVVMPLYSAIRRDRFGIVPALSPVGVWMGNCQEWCAVHQAEHQGFTTYFVESEKYFGRSGFYHDAALNDYLDNARRFGFLSQAALQVCKDIGFHPDIVHVHDWQTAPAAAYLKDWYAHDAVLAKTASVLTIHNIAYQGIYDPADMPYLGFGWENFHPDKFESWGKLNLLKGGIAYADVVNTVSPSYARETRTPQYGCGLAPYLNNRGEDYVGILNGADYEDWDPATDKHLPARYHPEDLSGKDACKRELQRRLNLDQDPTVPIIGVVSRFAAQKGLDQLAQVIESIVNSMRVQFAILGSGDKSLEGYFYDLPARYPGRIGSWIGYEEPLSHLIEAGSDFFVMPSLYEPCGLNQIYSLKYGTLPIVRATGGLDDSVIQYDEKTGEGTGFKYWLAQPSAIYYTVGWAVSTWYDRRPHIDRMRQAAMAQDFSWAKSAKAYEELYGRAIRHHQAWQ
jgi:starch synthase